MDWLSLVVGAVKLLNAFTGFLHDNQMIGAGEAKAISAGLTATLDEISKAQAAREKSDADFDNNPASQTDDDGFERKD